MNHFSNLVTGERGHEDFRIENHGSIIAITPMSEAARAWVNENLQTEPWQWLGGSLCVDWRMAEPIFAALNEVGFTVE